MENLIWLRSERTKHEEHVWFWKKTFSEYDEFCGDVETQWQDEAATTFRGRYRVPHQLHLEKVAEYVDKHQVCLEVADQPISEFYSLDRRCVELSRTVELESDYSRMVQHDVSASLQGYSQYANLAQLELQKTESLLAKLKTREQDE